MRSTFLDEMHASFSADITPLKLAAQLEDYEMIRLLLQHGHAIERPHPPGCE